MRHFFAAICTAVLFGWATPQPAASAASETPPLFIYDDLDLFGAAHVAIAGGENPVTAFERYVAGASPAFQFYAKRYKVTPQSLVEEYQKRPKFYGRLARLKPELQRQEPIIRSGLARLSMLAGRAAKPPIYFLVANQTAGGTPVELDAAKPPTLGIAIAIDMVSMASDVDMSEFPTGRSGRASLADIAYVAIHETAHIHQVEAQGGLENYRSIYRPGQNSTNLAVAVREGCADYLTFLASGLRRTGDQDSYGKAHERELWNEFQKVMDAPAFSVPGWFAGNNDRFPQWPSQIGYWLGGQMCSHHHRVSEDKKQAIRDMFAAHRPTEMKRFADSYARKY